MGGQFKLGKQNASGGSFGGKKGKGKKGKNMKSQGKAPYTTYKAGAYSSSDNIVKKAK